LFNRLITVFIRHHGHYHYGQEKFEECRDKGVEMPDVWKIEDPLVRQVELDRANIEFNGCHQGYGGQQEEIGEDEDPADPVVPEFYKFYMQ
jgi:hypothetical protein